MSIQDLDFYFYFVAFFTVTFGWIGVGILMYGKSTEISMLWLAGTFVGYIIDWAIIETIITLLGKSDEGTTRCCKKRGFYFDFDTYKKFY